MSLIASSLVLFLSTFKVSIKYGPFVTGSTSATSKDKVGVLLVLLVTKIDLIIIVYVDAAVNNAVSLPVANATPLNL